MPRDYYVFGVNICFWVKYGSMVAISVPYLSILPTLLVCSTDAPLAPQFVISTTVYRFTQKVVIAPKKKKGGTP